MNIQNTIKSVLLNEVEEPRSQAEYDFKQIHSIEVIDDPEQVKPEIKLAKDEA
jgi:hypothetical protein